MVAFQKGILLQKKIFQGYNATLLAYGQTGSGKTYTMGTAYKEMLQEEFVGITPRVINSIFKKIESDERNNIADYKIKTISVSYINITVRCDGGFGWFKLIFLLITANFFWTVKFKDFPPF